MKKLKLKKKKDDTKIKLEYYLSKGLDLEDARVLSGCSKVQLELFRCDPDFEDIVQCCLASLEHEQLDNLSIAARDPRNWAAASWLLERRFPEKYGKKDTVKHEINVRVMTFQKVVLDVLQEVDPKIKQLVIQKLREKSANSSSLLPPPVDSVPDGDFIDV